VIQEVKDINKKEQDFKTKLEALNTLKAHRAGPVKILDALQTAVPKKVWITAAGEKGGAMALAGEALSQDDLAEFMSALQNVVDTPQGLGRLVIDERGKESRVELTSTGKIASFKPSEVTPFFTNVQLTGDAEALEKGLKTVKFTLTLSANYSA
jgi:type IV pilus assembly protein PilN